MRICDWSSDVCSSDLGIAFSGLAALSGCGLLVVGGTAATTAVVATDRRTAGEQVEDQVIEMKSGSELRALFGDKARVNTTSYGGWALLTGDVPTEQDKKKARSEEHTSELQSLMRISYAVFCLKKKKRN